MERGSDRADAAAEGPGMLAGMALIAALGVALGLAYNAAGLASKPSRGLAWVTPDPGEGVVSLEEIARASGTQPEEPSPASGGSFTTDVSDPMAIAGTDAPAGTDVPEIPVLDRPIAIQLTATKQLFDGEAALFVDAREADEYAAGHIPGALSMPFDEVTSEPERMEQLDARGRPIIVYCGGGDCELSRDLAWELIFAGHTRVTFYEGGFPEWQEAGYPVASGAPSAPDKAENRR